MSTEPAEGRRPFRANRGNTAYRHRSDQDVAWETTRQRPAHGHNVLYASGTLAFPHPRRGTRPWLPPMPTDGCRATSP